MRIPKEMIEDLRKQGFYINSRGKQRFNSGRILLQKEIRDLIKQYVKPKILMREGRISSNSI